MYCESIESDRCRLAMVSDKVSEVGSDRESSGGESALFAGERCTAFSVNFVLLIINLIVSFCRLRCSTLPHH